MADLEYGASRSAKTAHKPVQTSPSLGNCLASEGLICSLFFISKIGGTLVCINRSKSKNHEPQGLLNPRISKVVHSKAN